ncbi:MAG: hypothetical protein IPK94_10270 [Saprospiraceae bacterium]|nr:hypothetical protein [Saprospiraceae bacterium]
MLTPVRSHWNEKNIAGTYHDLATNEKFDVLLQPEPWLILKKLWAEFFLALRYWLAWAWHSTV